LSDGAKEHFEGGRLSYKGEYLKPAKRLLVDLVVSKVGLEKALAFADRLFKRLERQGHRVVIAPHGEDLRRAGVHEDEDSRRREDYNNLWYPCRCTVAYFGTVAIGLTVIEMVEDIEMRYVDGEYIRANDPKTRMRELISRRPTWTTTQAKPTGRLRLQAFSPYPLASWVRSWQESKTRGMGSQIKNIVEGLEAAAPEIVRLLEEGERRAEIEHREWLKRQEEWRIEEKKRRAALAHKESRVDLLQIIRDWGEANRIEQFFQDAERRAADLGESERVRVLERLKLARGMVGSVDAMDHFIQWKSPEER
jgi:hypothetical protein